MAYTSPSKEELLSSIRPDMKLTWNFFKRIYGYEISWPGFADQAIATLEANGCSHARGYYEAWVSKYEAEQAAEMKKVAIWFGAEYKGQWKKGQKEGEGKRLEEMINRELLTLLKSLTGGEYR